MSKEELIIECSIEWAPGIIGSKWSFLILRELFCGTKRFGELERAVQGISPKSLSDTLRRLEADDIIVRTVYPKYTLTEKGQDFHKIIKEMKLWGAKWR
ncbi:helix-turn-helix transcriptional regulator [Domibacillus sp. PGB-M46]|uniref:winged helix-turn-helix transcriptional regulator n=1 Tax=Domibacillus sp. PGB-M46 TaxID=2910255 RepID=UPI001F56A070|nr:helix-turn-helix domain-containing protein [Domibacillus sp. PGB-M46]MCI2252806.1 helix-turn-helix transcriptional regulator [Domibacillus sp. PGB-M46]